LEVELLVVLALRLSGSLRRLLSKSLLKLLLKL
jgi:hypothetical protein